VTVSSSTPTSRAESAAKTTTLARDIIKSFEVRRGLRRTHAEDLRRQAVAAGDATTVVPIQVLGGVNRTYTESKLVFTRSLLADEAVRADGRAQHLESRLAAGDGLAGADLQLLCSQLEPLPDPEPAAV